MKTDENLKPTDNKEISKWYTPMQIISLTRYKRCGVVERVEKKDRVY